MDLLNTMQWYDYVRLTTVASSLATMYLLGHTFFVHHEDYTPAIFDHWAGKNLFLLAAFVGTLEAIVKDSPNNVTLFLVCFATLFSLRATLSSKSPDDVENAPRFRK